MQPYKQPYNSQLHTDTNSLVQAYMTRPTELTPVITHLAGKTTDKFPLSFLTEGLGNTKSITQDEYKYKVDQDQDDVRQLVVAVSETDPGLGNTQFELTFKDSWMPPDYTLFSRSGIQVRIMSGPYSKGGSGVGYMVQMMDPDPQAIMPASDVEAGATFSKGYAPVEQDYSRGNASTWTAPFEIRHKLSTLRKSYNFSGNAANTEVVGFPMKNKSGKTINTWLDWEEYKHMLDFRFECESYYWYGQQNYDAQGRSPMIGKNGYPIIVGPGLLDQIINKDTFSQLTEDKINNIIGQLYYKMYDADNMNITLYTGSGGLEDFDKAMKDYLRNNTFTQFNQGKFVTGSGQQLQLGGYFRRYQHIQGHFINVVYNKMFDHGPVAQARDKHPRTQYSLESHRMVFVDQGRYNGESNIKMVNKQGREMKRWAVSGSEEPGGYKTGPSRASDIDGASVHFLKHGGICLLRFDTSLDLQCVASH